MPFPASSTSDINRTLERLSRKIYRPAKPGEIGEGITLTRGQTRQIAEAMRDLGRLTTVDAEGRSVRVDRLGPYQEILLILSGR
jgi:hypothetical protein